MAGHSHWKQIKEQKSSADEKRGKAFSKLLAAIVVAARNGPNPAFNPRLKAAIERAAAANVPKENIERAIARSAEKDALEEIIVEAYGPGGIALVIQCVTDNRNRTMQELRHLLGKHGGKVAEPGSVRWAFEAEKGDWKAKFPQTVNEETRRLIETLMSALENHPDVQRAATNMGPR